MSDSPPSKPPRPGFGAIQGKGQSAKANAPSSDIKPRSSRSPNVSVRPVQTTPRPPASAPSPAVGTTKINTPAPGPTSKGNNGPATQRESAYKSANDPKIKSGPAPNSTSAPTQKKPSRLSIGNIKEAGFDFSSLPIGNMILGAVATFALIGVVVVSVTLGKSCERKPKIAGLTPPPANLVPDASIPISNPRATSEKWQQAIENQDDPIELTRLADDEGAAGLLEALEEGGGVGVVALLALPYAQDSELALRRLTEISRQVDEAALMAVLDCIEAISQRPVKQREHLDPTGYKLAFDAMVELSRKEQLSKPARARAVSVGRILSERAPVDLSKLPKEFDGP